MSVLMLSVFKIRKFYRENKITEEMNTKAMVIHVLAFAGYVLSNLVLTAMIILEIAFPKNDTIKEVFLISIIPLVLTGMIAEIILCTIFWQFGSKLEAPNT
jgi:hypothetical protein